MWKFISGIAFAAALYAPGVQAQTAGDFYSGKQINMIVGFNPGGTYDLYSRLAAEWLPKYIPGNPTIIVQNMPGAGGILAANYLSVQASKDGLTIGTISQASALQQVVRGSGVQYDVRELNWIGRFTPVVEVTTVWNAGTDVRTIEDAKSTKTVLSATSAGATSEMLPNVMNKIVGTQFDLVLGYPGTTGAQHAMETGEVEGSHSTMSNLLTNKPEWLADNLVSVLVQYAADRNPSLPDVPAMTEFATSDEDRQILALFASTAEIGRSIVAPPGIAPEQLVILRDAFTAMVEDPAFAADLAERNLEFGPMSGEELQAKVSLAVDIPAAVADRVIEMMKSDK